MYMLHVHVTCTCNMCMNVLYIKLKCCSLFQEPLPKPQKKLSISKKKKSEEEKPEEKTEEATDDSKKTEGATAVVSICVV